LSGFPVGKCPACIEECTSSGRNGPATTAGFGLKNPSKKSRAERLGFDNNRPTSIGL
jgi:hypothetical protein